jgi:hypothetical protein
LIPNGAWDPFAFIDACAEASRKPKADRMVLRAVQREEFFGLLDWLVEASS